MPENNMEYRSLCSTCKNAVDCTFPKDHQKPVLNCEEFEIDMGLSVKATEKVKSLSTCLLDAEREASKSIGLCSNCENRRACGFPRPEGGVWHCEEYR